MAIVWGQTSWRHCEEVPLIRVRRDAPPRPAEEVLPARATRARGAGSRRAEISLRATSVLGSDNERDIDPHSVDTPLGRSHWAAVHLGERVPPPMWSDDDDVCWARSSPPRRRRPPPPANGPAAERPPTARALWPVSASPSPPPPADGPVAKRPRSARALWPGTLSPSPSPLFQRPAPPELRDIAELAAFCAADQADSTGLEMLDVARLLAASAPDLPPQQRAREGCSDPRPGPAP